MASEPYSMADFEIAYGQQKAKIAALTAENEDLKKLVDFDANQALEEVTADVSALKRDLDSYMRIANDEAHEAEALRTERDALAKEIARLKLDLVMTREEMAYVGDVQAVRDRDEAAQAALTEAEEALRNIKEIGTRTKQVRIGDMYDERDGYAEYTEVSEEAEIAEATLSRLTQKDKPNA